MIKDDFFIEAFEPPLYVSPYADLKIKYRDLWLNVLLAGRGARQPTFPET